LVITVKRAVKGNHRIYIYNISFPHMSRSYVGDHLKRVVTPAEHDVTKQKSKKLKKERVMKFDTVFYGHDTADSDGSGT